MLRKSGIKKRCLQTVGTSSMHYSGFVGVISKLGKTHSHFDFLQYFIHLARQDRD